MIAEEIPPDRPKLTLFLAPSSLPVEETAPMGDPTENSTYCFNFTASDLKTNTAVTVSLHLIAVLACIVTIIFIFATKQHHAFVNRLVLYLMIVASIWSLTIMAEVVPVVHESSLSGGVTVRQGWEEICAIVGFLTQVVETAKILVVCWIVLYLLLLVVFKYNASKLSHEVIGLTIVVAVPLALDWLPFCWGSYGLSGLWCWIELTNANCEDVWRGLGLMLAVEYVPMILTILLTALSFISITVTLCRRSHRTEIKWKWTSVYQKGLAEAAALMVYPCIYAIIFIFRVIHRTYYVIQISKTTPPNYTLWLTHSAALGIGGILVPLLYILRPSNLRKFYFCRRFCLKEESALGVVYRSNSIISEGLSEGEVFVDSGEPLGSGSGGRDSSLLYKSILS